MTNTQRVTLACFLAYFVMSGMLSPIGIILPGLAEHLALSPPDAARLFGWLTFGILIGSGFAIGAVSRVSLRAVFLAVAAGLVISLAYLRVGEQLLGLQLSLGFTGICCGVALAAAASSITALYSAARRASMLVITDASFSTAGILVSMLAVQFVRREWHWASTYLVVCSVAAMIFGLAASARFPGPGSPAGSAGEELPAADLSPAIWPAPVWLCVAALFLYTLGQYSLLWWFPLHLEYAFALPRDHAGAVVSRFWTGMFLAQLFVAWCVLRIGVTRMMLFGAVGALLGTLPLVLGGRVELIPTLAVLWGFANLGLLKTVIAFATLTVPTPRPSLVSTLLFGATAGTAVSPYLTSAVVAVFGYGAVLRFGALCYATLLVLLLLSAYLARARSLAREARL